MLHPVRAAVTQPLRRPVPADDLAYLRRKGPVRLALRTWRRMLQFAASGQAATLCTAIAPTWRRALWIHDEAPQIGDALMDLAPRSLLRAVGIEADLLAAPHIAALFEGDRGWRRVHAELADLPHDHGYDFVIASSHLRRALDRKRRALPALPWVSLAGYYSVPDYHRGLFTTQRLEDLLGLDLGLPERLWHARQKLEVGPVDDAATPAPGGVAIAVGGVHADRIYPHWEEVVHRLVAGGVRHLRLIGSANGRAEADRLLAAVPPGVRMDDEVGRRDLHATQSLMRASRLVIAADGGLMHLGLTTRTPVLALFNAKVDPAWRLPPGDPVDWLRSPDGQVAGLAPGLVAEQALARLRDRSAPSPAA